MTAVHKGERPKAVAAAKGPDIRLIHSVGSSDMNSVAHTVNQETQDELFQVSLLASQGAAIASAISIEEALEALPDRTLLPILFDLQQKFEQIQRRLDAI